MAHVAAHGYPVPTVYGTTDTDMIMDHIAGPTMLEALSRQPWKAGSFGRLLGDLHDRLHTIPAPTWLPVWSATSVLPGEARGTDDGAGTTRRVLHLDLHPGNVILSPTGPVVIDWSNASAGDPAIDLAMTMVVIGTADAPSRALKLGRGWFLRGVRKGSETSYRERVADVAAARLSDPNMTEGELARLRKVIATAG